MLDMFDALVRPILTYGIMCLLGLCQSLNSIDNSREMNAGS